MIELDNEPWFVGKDVAEILGYERTADAVRTHVDEDDKGVGKIQTPGGFQEMIIINESGLYSLILSSKLESAKRFKKWVTSEVLPSIRKHGMYAVDEILENPDIAIAALQKLKEERAARKELELQNGRQKEEIQKMKPKALFADAVTASNTSILIGDLAKILKQNGIEIGAKRLFERLRNEGFLIKCGASRNMPTQRSMDMGLFEIKEGSYIDSQGNNVLTRTTKVSGKGQVYFVNRYM